MKTQRSTVNLRKSHQKLILKLDRRIQELEQENAKLKAGRGMFFHAVENLRKLASQVF